MVQNVYYSNGLPSHMTFPFEFRTPILSGIQMNQVVTVVSSPLYWDLETEGI